MKNLIAIAVLLISTAAFSQDSAWDYSTKTDIAGKTTETAFANSNDGASLVIRCKASCEAYISLDRTIAADQDSVRVKLNKAPLRSFSVNRGEGSDSLFFRNPMALLKAIRDNGGYMTVEYKPYQQTPATATFGIWNLPPTILARISSWDRQTTVAYNKHHTETNASSWQTQSYCEADGFKWHDEGCHAK